MILIENIVVVLVSVEKLVKIPENATLNDRKFSSKKHWKPTKGAFFADMWKQRILAKTDWLGSYKIKPNALMYVLYDIALDFEDSSKTQMKCGTVEA